MRLSLSRPTVVWVGVASFVAVLLMLALPSRGSSLPAYAEATGQPCSTCHVNPAGGGPLTAIGQAFQAIPTHASNPAAAFAQVTAPVSAPAPAPTAVPAAPAAPAAVAPTAVAPAAVAPTAVAPSTLPSAGEGPASPELPAILAVAGLLALGGGLGLWRRAASTR